MAKTSHTDIKGWMWVENRLIDDYLPIIGANGLRVYMMICREISDEDYPSISSMRQLLRLNTSNIIQALQSLKSIGLISSLRYVED